jgi:hypothetical protein
MIMDLSKPVDFMDDGKIAVYSKRQHATSNHECGAHCGGDIEAGEDYLRVQFVRTDDEEDLTDLDQARGVPYRRRVVLKFHLTCTPTEVPL